MTLEFPEIVAPTEAPAQAPAAAVAAELVDTAAVSDGKVLVNYSRTEAALADLRERYTGAQFDLTTTKGDKAARAARQELVTLRTGLEKKRLELKRPALEFGRKIDAEAERITGQIRALEKPIDAQIEADEKRRANEAAERKRLDDERQAKHTANIAKIAAMLTGAEDKSAERLANGVALVDNLLVEGYEEFQPEAEATRTRVLLGLKALHQKAVDREAAAKLLAAQTLALEIGQRVTDLIGQPADAIRDALNLLELTAYATDIDVSVNRAHEAALKQLRTMLAAAEKSDADAAELAKLRAAQAPAAPARGTHSFTVAEVTALMSTLPAAAPVPPAPAPEPAPAPVEPVVQDPPRVFDRSAEPVLDAAAMPPAAEVFTHGMPGLPLDSGEFVPASQLNAPKPVDLAEPATLKLGTICERFGPGFSITAAFVSDTLGIQLAGTERAAKLYRASDFARICDALVAHIDSMRGAS